MRLQRKPFLLIGGTIDVKKGRMADEARTTARLKSVKSDFTNVQSNLRYNASSAWPGLLVPRLTRLSYHKPEIATSIYKQR